MTRPIRFRCPNPECGNEISVPARYAGTEGSCDACGILLRVPAAPPAPPPAPRPTEVPRPPVTPQEPAPPTWAEPRRPKEHDPTFIFKVGALCGVVLAVARLAGLGCHMGAALGVENLGAEVALHGMVGFLAGTIAARFIRMFMHL